MSTEGSNVELDTCGWAMNQSQQTWQVKPAEGASDDTVQIVSRHNGSSPVLLPSTPLPSPSLPRGTSPSYTRMAPSLPLPLPSSLATTGDLTGLTLTSLHRWLLK